MVAIFVRKPPLHPKGTGFLLNDVFKNMCLLHDNLNFSEQNHKTVFGWRRIKINDEDKFYHHLVNVNLINIVDNETIKQQTIELIETKYPNSFTSNGKMKKLLEKAI